METANVSVADICNAYESGVGHRGRPTARVNPYREGTHEHEAYALGAAGEPAAQPVAVPEGYALVPVEPTAEMIAAGWFNGDMACAIGHALAYADSVRDYKAMLSAAKKQGDA